MDVLPVSWLKLSLALFNRTADRFSCFPPISQSFRIQTETHFISCETAQRSAGPRASSRSSVSTRAATLRSTSLRTPETKRAKGTRPFRGSGNESQCGSVKNGRKARRRERIWKTATQHVQLTDTAFYYSLRSVHTPLVCLISLGFVCSASWVDVSTHTLNTAKNGI